MTEQLAKAARIIGRLRERNRHAHEAMIAQARIITELDCARSDIFDLTNKPLHFLRATLAEARELLGPQVEITMAEAKDGMRMGFSGVGRTRVFDVTESDYDQPFPLFLDTIKRHLEQ